MRQAIVDTCDLGHKFYYEEGALRRCPYCLAQGLDAARTPAPDGVPSVKRPNLVASSDDVGVTAYHSVEPDFGGKAKILATVGLIADDEIARLTADGLVLLWRHGAYAFLARLEANEAGNGGKLDVAPDSGSLYRYDEEPDD